MYSRQNDRSRDIRIPRNYSGNVIFTTPADDIPTKQHSPKDQPLRRRRAEVPERVENINDEQFIDNEPQFASDISDVNETEEKQEIEVATQKTADNAAPTSIFSPIGALGTEELLLIALALIIFQSGKEPELALLLLALLFIN